MKTLAVVLSMLFLASPKPFDSALPCLAHGRDDVAKKVTETYAGAADWLLTQQDESGAWKMTAGDKSVPSPSFTGLIVAAFGNAPADLKGKVKPAADKGIAYLLSKVNTDGSIGEGPTGSFVKTYATGIALMAFASVERNDKIANAI